MAPHDTDPGGTRSEVELPPGSTVLLDATTGVDTLAFVGSHRPAATSLLAVTVGRTPRSYLEEWWREVGTRPNDAAIVGVGTFTRSIAARARESRQGGRVRTVSDPADLDAIERHVREILAGWHTDGPTVVHVDGLDHLLDATDEDDVARFVADLDSLVADAGAICVLSLDATADEDRAIDALRDTCEVVAASVDGWTFAGYDSHANASIDDAFDVLSSERRRLVLQYLAAHGETTVEGLVAHLWARERAATGTDEESLAASLVHVHLPKLAAVGAVDFDPGTGVVERGRAFDDFRSLLEAAVAVGE